MLAAALTANAIRPVPGFKISFPVFFAGWLTGELAPHLLAATVADATTHVVRRPGGRRSVAGLALAGVTAIGLSHLIRQSHRVGDTAEQSLVDGIGLDYVEQLDAPPTPQDLAIPWRSLVYPFRMRNDAVRVDRNIAYAPEHGGRGTLDVYRPVHGDLSNAPVLLQVHGGGWTSGTRLQNAVICEALAAAGIVVASLDFRMPPEAKYPASINDLNDSWSRRYRPGR